MLPTNVMYKLSIEAYDIYLICIAIASTHSISNFVISFHISQCGS